MRKKAIYYALAAAGLFAVYKVFFGGAKSAALKESSFEYAAVERRDIRASVSANGNVSPVNVVSVGAQVSGKIDKIYVDYNSRVKQGQLLAVVDKSLLVEDVKSNEAKLKDAQQKYDLAKLNERRYADLYKSGYIAQIEHDQAKTELAGAYSNFVTARSNLDRSRTNLGYAEIKSPVSGVVISKDVEEGQTIASSFSAPTLFKIAEDLKKMQISASISEADIGSIRQGQSVDFTVDAYPADTFRGAVEQIRLNPTTEQNIVVYSVIVGIDNKDEKLLPGMTAFVDINTAERKDVVAVANAVFSFRPDDSVAGMVDYPENRNVGVGEAMLYKFDASSRRLKGVKVRRGSTDGKFTEISAGGISDGDRIISDYAQGVKKGASGNGAMRRPGGGPGRGGPL
ncbi:MAG: efflux RND transporter periplasmic adaptor subunit [Rickettsiales bacterium]|nr:efflux RND transporter periplasmic adaptor subunit [Rickettsiales bacterium]